MTDFSMIEIFGSAKERFDVLTIADALGLSLKLGMNLSPFREETHPSFSVYDGGRKFKDHGSDGAGGDCVEFLRIALGSDLQAARQWLADRLGIDLSRPAGFDSKAPRPKPTPKPQPDLHAARRTHTAQRAAKLLEEGRDDEWRANFWHESPIRIPGNLQAQARLVIHNLFPSEATLWSGRVKDSGKPCNAVRFRTAAEWLDAYDLGPRFATGHFRTDCISRGGDNIITSPFIVVEGDKLIGCKPVTPEEKEENKCVGAGLIRILDEVAGYKLRAVIDTGNKSLHALFDKPQDEEMRKLAEVASALGIDDSTLDRPANPLRLPGCIHDSTGQPARLYYLNPIVT